MTKIDYKNNTPNGGLKKKLDYYSNDKRKVADFVIRNMQLRVLSEVTMLLPRFISSELHR